MAKLVECVPNYSEGRRPEVLDAICAAITSVEGVMLLDREMDADHNRAVVTFACHPGLAVEAAFRGYQKAAELIDMRTHSGEHPRMGACDVCPFIPLAEMELDEAIELAHTLGKRVGNELAIPVYLYESAATSSSRKNLANVRSGEYEGIRDSIATDPARKPDYGPSMMNLKAGSTAIGVRFPLVAFNVYLDTDKKWVADKIADAVRHLTGGYRFVKALGFEIHERKQVQISMNLTNYTKTPVYRVFDTIRREAQRYGVAVVSSEIIGLTPLDAIVEVADYYLQLENFSRKQLLEERLRQAVTSAAGPTESFYDQVASSAPAPGGGSVAASCGALSAALAAMVCRLTIGKKKYEAVREELTAVREQADQLRKELETLIDTDKEAFLSVMAAFKLPKNSDAELAAREAAVQEATKKAALVPLTVMTKAVAAIALAKVVAEKGNENSISDAGVAGLAGVAAVEGAGYNVRINLKSLTDRGFVDSTATEVKRLRSDAARLAEAIRTTVESKL